MVFGNLSTGYWLGAAGGGATEYKVIGRTAVSSGDDIDVTVTAKDNMMVLQHLVPSGQVDQGMHFNDDGGSGGSSNYAWRIRRGGSVTGQGINTYRLNTEELYPNTAFEVFNMQHTNGQEKLLQWNVAMATTTGAGTAPSRTEGVGKWANTGNVTKVSFTGISSVPYATGSEVVVLGCDNDESNSGTNAWQLLASVDTSTAHDVIDTGTFTNKKYLWLQCYVEGDTNANGSWIFNDDTNQTGYAIRRSNNGGADTGQYAGNNPAGSEGAYDGWGATGAGKYYNMFIVNNGANEALWINHLAIGDSTGAGDAPNRNEVVGKWDLTDSITRIRIKNQDANTDYDTSSIRVWGFD